MVVMFISSQYLLSVIFLTIVTLTRSFPTKTDSYDVSAAVLSSGILRNFTNDTKVFCSNMDLSRYGDKFNLIYYACMDLYDVSLQLSEIKHVIIDSGKVPTAKEFCKELKFYDKRVNATQYFVDEAVKYLRTPANCETVCFKDDSTHPICQAIYFGNKFLLNEERQAESFQKSFEHTDVLATTQSQSSPTPTEAQVVSLSDHVHDGQESAKLLPTKSEKPKNAKEERKPETVNSTVEESDGNKISKATKSYSAQKNTFITSKDDEQEKIPSADAQPDKEPKLEEVSKPDAQPQQTFSDQKLGDSDTRILGKQLSGGSPSLPPANPAASIAPSATQESLYSNFADDTRDSSKDTENEIEDGDVSFKEDTGSSIISQEDSPNIYASGEPEENLGLTGNKYSSRFPHAQDSHFFAYFLTMVVICIIGYLVFHNKQKIIALALEGRRMQGSRRRPNTSSYKKLDSNLEEAVTSNCSSSSVTHVIF